jgi:hypothetical protein
MLVLLIVRLCPLNGDKSEPHHPAFRCVSCTFNRSPRALEGAHPRVRRSEHRLQVRRTYDKGDVYRLWWDFARADGHGRSDRVQLRVDICRSFRIGRRSIRRVFVDSELLGRYSRTPGRSTDKGVVASSVLHSPFRATLPPGPLST